MEIPRHWRLNGQRYSLKGSICTCCGKMFFAPRPVCDACRPSELAERSAVSERAHTYDLETAYIAQR